jgi:hypothetical protein
MTDSVENKIRSAVRSVEPSPVFSDQLWKRIQTIPQPMPTPRRSFRWAWAPASAVVCIGLALGLIFPQTVLAAFRSLFAYIPGIGLVQNDADTLYLAQPVTAEQDGAVLTIDQVVADANTTVVSYHVSNQAGDSAGAACFYDDNTLVLKDGKTLRPTGGGVENNEARVEFFALPAKSTQATLHAGRNVADPGCVGPREWNVAFTLGPIPPTTTLMPVYENESTPAPVAQSAAAQTDESTVQLVLDRTAVLDDGYILIGHIDWSNPDWLVANIDAESITAVDATGKTFPVSMSESGNTDNTFAYKVTGKDITAPLTVTVQKVWVMANTENSSKFSFDAGSDPQPGQSWDLNQEIEVAGQKIAVKKVQVVEETIEGQAKPIRGYAFETTSASNVDGNLICSGTGESYQTFSQSRNDAQGNKITEVLYPNGLPSGTITCHFGQIQFTSTGSWQFEWQPTSEMK